MTICFKDDVTVDVVQGIDQHGNPMVSSEKYQKDDTFEGDLMGDNGHCINFQFGDGSTIYGLSKNYFTVMN